MKKYDIQLSCGCCSDTVTFKNEQAIAEAFKEAGLSSSATIIDDTGYIVENVDTFYGYRELDENGNKKEEEGHLERLFNQINRE